MKRRTATLAPAPSPATTPRARGWVRRLWTPAEDRRLRRLATPTGRARAALPWPRLQAAFPSRTREAIQQRMSALKLRTKAWTPAEDRKLLLAWPESCRRTLLAKFPTRTWTALHARAKRLGLSTVPQGWMTVDAAAKRAGVLRTMALRICAQQGVAVQVHTTKSTAHRRAAGRPARGTERTVRRYEWKLVEWDAFEAAVARDVVGETTTQAARRLGVSGEALVDRLLRAGLTQRARGTTHVHRDPAVYDQLLARWPLKTSAKGRA